MSTPTAAPPPDAASLGARVRDLRGSPKDIARWAFWVPFRKLLDPHRPAQLRLLYPLWRAQHAVAAGQKALMRQELALCFPESAAPAQLDALVEEAYRVAFRVHFEELLLGKLDADTVQLYMRIEGREHLDAALARGKGALILLPHAGNIMMLIAAISLAGIPYTQYAARGLAPPEVAEAHPEVFGHNRWRKATREAREANEDRLPANFLDGSHSVRHLFRRLAANETVGIAYDGRIGTTFEVVDYLGRRALLNPGPYKLAARTGAAIVGATCACPPDGPNVLQFHPPIHGDGPDAMRDAFLHGVAEPFLRAHPGHYGVWLAHARERRAVDDHPMFVDYAPDDRWKKYLT